ncbi:MAG: VOC family protein [Pseudomonas sp.]|uniref:VOC family protein n=1 Tax=Pseudomonas sp. TaxID=306 RepID=UPI00339A907A
MIDHLSIVVSDYPRSRAWYQQVLATLGYELKSDTAQGPALVAGFGPVQQPYGVLYLVSAGPGRGVCQARPQFCFCAPERTVVDAFHAAALQAGGRDSGAPGWREAQAHYAAFAQDPDGYSVEVACYR